MDACGREEVARRPTLTTHANVSRGSVAVRDPPVPRSIFARYSAAYVRTMVYILLVPTYVVTLPY